MLRSDGIQIAESAAARMQSDSIVVNQTEILWPDSCQMISGRVLPMTAAHAMIRGHGLDVAGVAGFIWLGDNCRLVYGRRPSVALNLSSLGISPTSMRNDSIAAGM